MAKPDIWMPLYIGDYLADTAHLDAEQSGCYLHWLMHYWRRGPLVNSIPELVKVGKLRGEDAPSIAQALLDEFFTLEEDGRWHQKRTDAELTEWNGKSLKAKAKAKIAAAARWGKDAPSNAPSNAPSSTQAMLEQCPSPSPSPSPIERNTLSLLPTEKPHAQFSPHNLFSLWNQYCGNLPNVEAFTEKRKRKAQARIKSGLTEERFVRAVRCCTEKPFLRGENSSGWTATLDWLIHNDENIEKAINNPYGAMTNGNGKPNFAERRVQSTKDAADAALAAIRSGNLSPA